MTDTEANQSKTNVENVEIKETRVQKWAVNIAAGILIGALLVYITNFHGGISGDTSVWGEFGDYLGGVVNPIIGFFTICLLAASLKQNQHALAQSRRELELARDAIEQVKDVQNATKEALTAQIQIADQTRDFANAAVLFEAIEQDIERMKVELRNIGNVGSQTLAKRRLLDQRILEARQTRAGISSILNTEAMRLVKKYRPNSDTEQNENI